MIPATYPSILDSSNRTKMLVYQVPSIVGLTRWIDYIPVKSPASESDLTLANTFANEGFILTSKVNDITGLVPFKDYVPIYLDSTATKAWSADNDGYIPMAELAGLLLDFTTGSLDSRINFSRTTNATVTNSAGLITYAPHNLLTFSEQFDNAYWKKFNITLSANQETAPNGTLTAEKFYPNLSGTDRVIGLDTTTISSVLSTHTASIYLKSAGLNFAYMQLNAGGAAFVTINLTTGEVGTPQTLAGSPVTSVSSTNIGNGWYRLNFSILPTTALNVLYIGGCDGQNTRTVTASGTNGIYIWGAQLEIGSTATTYNSTTVKNLLGYSELFDNAAWAKSNSFVQTNLLTYSEAFDDSSWAKIGTTSITSNTTIAPNGYQTADTLTGATGDPSVGVTDTLARTVTVSSSTSYTFSVYVRGIIGTTITILLRDASSGAVGATTQTLTSSWQRISCTLTSSSGTTAFSARVGSTNGTVAIWGAQLVQGSVAGDYRRTDAASLPCYYPNHNGVVCAEKLVENATTNPHATFGNLVSFVTGQVFTWSVYAKAAERQILQFVLPSGFGGSGFANFNLSTGQIGSSNIGTPAISSLGNGWYRCSITATATGTGTQQATINIVTSSTSARNESYAGDGTSGIYIFGAQLSDSASLDPYVLNAAAAPTAAAYYGARFDYDPVTLAPKGLLIEEQRTNVATYSNDFTVGIWVKSGSTVTGSYAVSPDGTQNAARWQIASGQTPYNAVSNYMTTGQTFTCSFYVKSNTGVNQTFRLFMYDNALRYSIDLTATTTWQRFTHTVTSAASGPANSFGISVGSAGTTVDLQVFGAQWEAGAFATSYIPTAASQVTRAADNATIQGSNFYSWYNLNDSTLYVEGEFNGGQENFYALTGNSYSDFGITQRRNSSTSRIYDVYTASGVYVGGSSTSVLSTATEFKEAIAFTTSSAQASVNGVLGSIVSGYISTGNANRLAIGQYFFTYTMCGYIKKISYYPQRLSNDVLKGLTA